MKRKELPMNKEDDDIDDFTGFIATMDYDDNPLIALASCIGIVGMVVATIVYTIIVIMSL